MTSLVQLLSYRFNESSSDCIFCVVYVFASFIEDMLFCMHHHLIGTANRYLVRPIGMVPSEGFEPTTNSF